MIRLITIIILCLCYIQAFSEEQLKFLGFPIDGSVNDIQIESITYQYIRKII